MMAIETIVPTLGMTAPVMEAVLALSAYAFATSITPGPNNLILAASGATYGMRRTIPNIVGVVAGFSTLVLLVGIAGEAVLTALPQLETAMRWAGCAYLLYLAWKIGTAGRPDVADGSSPLTFQQAFAFQFINPKGWAMALSAQAAFRIPALGEIGSVLAVTIVFALINLPCVGIWAGFGVGIRRWLRGDMALRIFNGTLGLLTAACAGLMFV
jgi:threonine/homoserine/homoserine lactone efflux protein